MTTMKNILWKLPKTRTSTVIITDSQNKHLYKHFEPNCEGISAFVTQPGACIDNMQSLPNFIP